MEYPITTRQLLCHTAGIRHYHEVFHSLYESATQIFQKKDEKKDKTDSDADPNEANKSTDPEYLSRKPYASVTESLDMFKVQLT